MGPPGWRRLPAVTRATLVLTVAGYLASLVTAVPARVLIVAPAAVWPGSSSGGS